MSKNAPRATAKNLTSLHKRVPRSARVDAIGVVEDDPFVRKSLQRLLGAMGFEAIAFGSAEDFLAYPNRSRLGCLLLDVNLPGMSGTDLFAHLTAIGDPLPVVLTSSEVSLPRNGRSGGRPVQVLAKPIDAEKLGSILIPAFAARKAR
jgi:FixJ family two-component response regulator